MELHWLLTLKWTSQSDMSHTWTGHGITYVQPGETRLDVYKRLRSEIAQATGIPETANVLFYSLEPNWIAG